jgi:chromosomal replication initiation ATPase DnaA
VRDADRVSSAPPPVGRSVEFALATAAVRALVDGRAGALVVEGEAGIGKTHLVQALAEEARSRDVTVC